MEKTSKSSSWQALAIIVGFPILYMSFCETAFAKALFVTGDLSYYIPFWGSIILIHWISVFAVFRFLKKESLTLADIGYKLSRKNTIRFISYFALAAVLLLIGVEITLSDFELDSTQLGSLSGLIPKTTTHRIFFILLVFSTGFCEEIVYRGFAITQLQKMGLNKWIALIIAALLFIGIHGFNAYSGRFVFLFGGGIMFGLVFLSSKRLLPSIIIHLVINLSAMMAILQLLK
jgi:membrane protease YdiL (CAAX protease family)